MSDYIDSKKDYLLDYEKECERHERYNVIIYGYFYAGFFAIWLAFKDIWLGDTKVSSIAAIFMIFSFSIFVLGEVLNLKIFAKNRSLLLKNVLTFTKEDVVEYEKVLAKYNVYEKKHTQRFIWIFLLSLCFAALGIATLLYLLFTASIQ